MPGPRLNTFSELLQKFEGGVVPGYQVEELSIPLSDAGEWVYLDPPIECDATDIIWSPHSYWSRSTGIFEYALNNADVTNDWIQCHFIPGPPLARIEPVNVRDFPIYRVHVRHNIVEKMQEEEDLQLAMYLFNDPRLTWKLNRGNPCPNT